MPPMLCMTKNLLGKKPFRETPLKFGTCSFEFVELRLLAFCKLLPCSVFLSVPKASVLPVALPSVPLISLIRKPQAQNRDVTYAASCVTYVMEAWNTNFASQAVVVYPSSAEVSFSTSHFIDKDTTSTEQR